MKIRPVGAELFHAGRTDRHDEANSRFSQFFESSYKGMKMRVYDFFPSSFFLSLKSPNILARILLLG